MDGKSDALEGVLEAKEDLRACDARYQPGAADTHTEGRDDESARGRPSTACPTSWAKHEIYRIGKTEPRPMKRSIGGNTVVSVIGRARSQ